MSYAAFWIEILVMSLLFTGLTIAVSGRFKGFWSWIVLMPNAFVFFALCAPAVGSAYLKYYLHLRVSYFGYAMSLLAACIVGASLLSRLGRRRPAGMPRAAARWKAAQLAVALLVCFAVFVMTVWNMDLEVRHRAEVVRAQAGARLLSITPPNVPDAANAAIHYTTAFKAMASDPQFSGPKSVMAEDGSPNPLDPRVIQLLTREAQSLELLREAASLPVCRFDRDYSAPSIDWLMPLLGQLRAAANLLKLDAAHELAVGHTRNAMADIEAIFALSRASGQLPMIISALCALGLDSVAVNQLQSALPHVHGADDLAPLHFQLWETPADMMQRGVYSEEAFGLAMFADIGSGEQSFPTMHDPFQPVQNRLSVIARLQDLPFRLFLLNNDEHGYERLFTGYHDMMGEPYYRAFARQNSAEFLQIFREGIITKIVAPALTRPLLSASKYDASHSAALVAIAITRYRLDHGSLPDSLDALVPDDLAQVPLDPFDGKPLRYRKTADDWRVYSIGPDNHDDGGAPYDSKAHTGNISFIVKNH